MAGTLERRLDLGDAVVIGAGSMIGAGVFVAWAPAARAAGTGLLAGLAIAALVAFANATSSAQLAAVHPESGGTYVYGRRQLGAAWGHLAGWGFVVGKTASCAAMALTVGAYVSPDYERPVAVAAVVGITAVNIGGLTRTAAVTRILLAVSLTTLAVVVAAGWSGGEADLGRITPVDAGLHDILQAGGFMFFAFAGYARIATLGEEVKNPRRTIPRAIPLALGAVLAVYTVVALTALATVDATALAATDTPLRLVVDTSSWSADEPIRVGAGIAALGVLLNLIPGISRTTLAMARRGELPRWLAHVDTERRLPLRAELTVASLVIGLVSLIDLRGAIAFSGVTILTYYAITNAAALTLSPSQRLWPKALAGFGLVGCLTLAAFLPPLTLAAGALVLLAGVIARRIVIRLGGPNPGSSDKQDSEDE